jgi:hypothetical protein
MGNCFTCFKPDLTASNASPHDPDQKISHQSRLGGFQIEGTPRVLITFNNFFVLIETDELLQQTTDFQLSKTNHFDNINGKKSLVNTNSNCSLIDDKQNIQSGRCVLTEGKITLNYISFSF